MPEKCHPPRESTRFLLGALSRGYPPRAGNDVARRNGARVAIMTFPGAREAHRALLFIEKRQESGGAHRTRADMSHIFARHCERVFRVLRGSRALSLGSIAPLRGKTLQGHSRPARRKLVPLVPPPPSFPAAISGPQFYAPPWNAMLFRAAARDDCGTAPAP